MHLKFQQIRLAYFDRLANHNLKADAPNRVQLESCPLMGERAGDVRLNIGTVAQLVERQIYLKVAGSSPALASALRKF